MIPMVDLKQQYQALQQEINPAILAALAETRFILGPNVSAFEQEAADFLKVKHAITCASGTDALMLALACIDLKPEDEVITTPFTFIATAEAIAYFGAKPVFVDIDAQTFNIDTNKIKAAITDKTKAIIPVHLFGQAANLGEIQTLCKAHNLVLIEDAAQSFGSKYQEKYTGTVGDMGCFSFFPSKNLGCYGDGGMITTHDDNLAEKIKIFRNHGSKKRYYHDILGYNSRLDELQAVILRIKLNHIEAYNQKRQQVAKIYTDILKEKQSITTPYQSDYANHVYHQYTLLLNNRDQVMETLKAQDIASAIYYPIPLHQQNVFKDQNINTVLPITEKISQQCLSLPIYPELTSEQAEYIAKTVYSAAL